MNINRDNYEEFFVLYGDNELSSEDRLRVEQFVEQHADLKQELELFNQLHFTPDQAVEFTGKDDLLRRDNEANAEVVPAFPEMQEALLLFLDNELSTERRAEFEGLLTRDAGLRNELALFRRTRLDATEQISHPNKQELYRREEKTRVIPMGWRRIAAVASLLIAVSVTAVVLYNRSSGPQGTELATNGGSTSDGTNGNGTDGNGTNGTGANNDASKSGTSNDHSIQNNQRLASADGPQDSSVPGDNDRKYNDPSQQHHAAPRQQVSDATSHSNDRLAGNDRVKGSSGASAPKNKTQDAIRQEPQQDVAAHNNLPKPSNNPNVQQGMGTQRSNDQLAANTKVQQQSSQTFSQPAVTPEPADSYILARNTTGDDDESTGMEPSSKKNKFRGFFRKVTRTFEKNTNIRATDDEDRLLVGGLAIRL